jgi:hypothetical protein
VIGNLEWMVTHKVHIPSDVALYIAKQRDTIVICAFEGRVEGMQEGNGSLAVKFNHSFLLLFRLSLVLFNLVLFSSSFFSFVFSLPVSLSGVVNVIDVVKSTAPHAIAALQARGIQCYMCTGDSKLNAEYCANEV